LERAVSSINEEDRKKEAIKEVFDAVKGTEKLLLDTFAKHGIRKENPMGKVRP
jgi:molecular chaperone GrpE (heat shock protein)